MVGKVWDALERECYLRKIPNNACFQGNLNRLFFTLSKMGFTDFGFWDWFC